MEEEAASEVVASGLKSEEDDMQQQEEEHQSQHFVLVHGVGHGAWCWFKLRILLERDGHRVSCFDLTGAGIDCSDPNTILSFQDYNKPLWDFMASLPETEKVILVGHSAGGLSVTLATRVFGEKIGLAIYVGATMLKSGLSSEEDFKEGVPDLSADVLQLTFGLGPNQPPTSATISAEFQHDTLYHLSPKEDSTLALMLLRPWPTMAMMSAKFQGGGGGREEENVDRVRRVFVKTLHDRMLKPEQQDAMIRRWPPSEVFTLETDHSPFFSAPTQLFHLLITTAASASSSSLVSC